MDPALRPPHVRVRAPDARLDVRGVYRDVHRRALRYCQLRDLLLRERQDGKERREGGRTHAVGARDGPQEREDGVARRDAREHRRGRVHAQRLAAHRVEPRQAEQRVVPELLGPVLLLGRADLRAQLILRVRVVREEEQRACERAGGCILRREDEDAQLRDELCFRQAFLWIGGGVGFDCVWWLDMSGTRGRRFHSLSMLMMSTLPSSASSAARLRSSYILVVLSSSANVVSLSCWTSLDGIHFTSGFLHELGMKVDIREMIGQ